MRAKEAGPPWRLCVCRGRGLSLDAPPHPTHHPRPAPSFGNLHTRLVDGRALRDSLRPEDTETLGFVLARSLQYCPPRGRPLTLTVYP